MEKLLSKISFDPDHGDHLIFVGDIVNKGPDSIGVVELARKYSASCVRGNHEDRILLLRKQMTATGNMLTEASDDDDLNPESHSLKEDRDRQLARQLNDEQAEWLERQPVILNVGQIHGLGQVVVVHAGLVPGVELEKQDPANVMAMRTIDTDTLMPSPKHKGTPWSAVCSFPIYLLYCPIFMNEYTIFHTAVKGPNLAFLSRSLTTNSLSCFLVWKILSQTRDRKRCVLFTVTTRQPLSISRHIRRV